MKNVLVIGAGPAGMAAAIGAARAGAKVTLLEGENVPGKKLLLTGNGSCNLTNLDDDCAERYGSMGPGAAAFAAPATESFGPRDVCRFFEELGMPLTVRDGLVYPASRSARTVLDVLLAELKRLKVTVKCSEKIREIRRTDVFEASTGSWTYRGDALILCAGSKACPRTGSDGSGYDLAAQAGLGVTKVMPALTALVPEDPAIIRACAGVRCQAALSLLDAEGKVFPAGEKVCPDEIGELQIARDGISGIAVFQLSRYAARILAGGGRPVLVLDLFPQYTGEEFLGILRGCAARAQDETCAAAFAGLAVPKLTTFLLEAAGIAPSGPLTEDAGEACLRLMSKAKRLQIPVRGTRSFEDCQVCAGGVSTGEIDPQTLMAKKVPGLYIAGELADIDGPCGGYNLQWAWASGMLAGRSAAAALPERN